ncbi:MAG: Abi family protein, partial [Endozoicomonas sp.]
MPPSSLKSNGYLRWKKCLIWLLNLSDGVSFDDILNLYIFDRELRLLIIDAIERVKVSLHTQFAYHLSHNHQTANPHLKSELFADAVAPMPIVCTDLEKEIKRSKDKEDFIRHLVVLLPFITAVLLPLPVEPLTGINHFYQAKKVLI